MKQNELMNQLHQILIQELIQRITSGEASSGDLSVARSFLRDNGIMAADNSNPYMEELIDNIPDIGDDTTIQ